MSRRVIYEWCYETLNEQENMLGLNFRDKLSEFSPDEISEDLVLVRDVFINGELTDRSWAYVSDGKLPTRTDDGDKVPIRFHNELERYYKRLSKA